MDGCAGESQANVYTKAIHLQRDRAHCQLSETNNIRLVPGSVVLQSCAEVPFRDGNTPFQTQYKDGDD